MCEDTNKVIQDERTRRLSNFDVLRPMIHFDDHGQSCLNGKSEAYCVMTQRRFPRRAELSEPFVLCSMYQPIYTHHHQYTRHTQETE